MKKIIAYGSPKSTNTSVNSIFSGISAAFKYLSLFLSLSSGNFVSGQSPIGTFPRTPAQTRLEKSGFQFIETKNYIGFAYPPLEYPISDTNITRWAAEQPVSTFIGLGETHHEFFALKNDKLADEIGALGYVIAREGLQSEVRSKSTSKNPVLHLGVESSELYDKSTKFYNQIKVPKTCETHDDLSPFYRFNTINLEDRNSYFQNQMKDPKMVFLAGNCHFLHIQSEPFVNDLKHLFNQVLFIAPKSSTSLLKTMSDDLVLECIDFKIFQTINKGLLSPLENIEMLTQHLKENPSFVDLQVELVNMYIFLSISNDKTENLNNALKHLKPLLKEYPKSLTVNMLYIQYLIKRGGKNNNLKALKLLKKWAKNINQIISKLDDVGFDRIGEKLSSKLRFLEELHADITEKSKYDL